MPAPLTGAWSLLLVPPLAPQATELQTLRAGDAAMNDSFGSAAALHGARVLIGAELDDLGLRADAGSAYVFERDGAGAWIQRAKLLAPLGNAGDVFGANVALSGERAQRAEPLAPTPRTREHVLGGDLDFARQGLRRLGTDGDSRCGVSADHEARRRLGGRGAGARGEREREPGDLRVGHAGTPVW